MNRLVNMNNNNNNSNINDNSTLPPTTNPIYITISNANHHQIQHLVQINMKLKD